MVKVWWSACDTRHLMSTLHPLSCPAKAKINSFLLLLSLTCRCTFECSVSLDRTLSHKFAFALFLFQRAILVVLRSMSHWCGAFFEILVHFTLLMPIVSSEYNIPRRGSVNMAKLWHEHSPCICDAVTSIKITEFKRKASLFPLHDTLFPFTLETLEKMYPVQSVVTFHFHDQFKFSNIQT